MLNVAENLNLRLRSVLYKTEDLQTILEEYNLQLWPGIDNNQELFMYKAYNLQLWPGTDDNQE